jgi:starch synthase
VTESKVSSPKILRVLFVAAEADPIIKVGGLGDVTGSLPRTLRALEPVQAMGYQLDVRLAIPLHPAITMRINELTQVAEFDVPHPTRPVTAKAFLTHVGDLPVYLIGGDPIPPDAPVYSLDTRKDGEKFTFFSLAVLELARALNWAPDILHANDWHTALAVYALSLRRSEDRFFANTRSVLTVHNLPYMGAGTDEALTDYGIPPLKDNRLPPWGGYQPLPMGLATADYITTVSPTYAREIMTPEFGCDLQDFLQMRAGSIAGILNGLDERSWDPTADPAQPETFDLDHLEKRAANKQALVREFVLPQIEDMPLLILISRMDRQKGVDLVVEALRQVAALPWQAVLLGTGEPSLEAAMRQLEAEFPYRARAIIRFDGQLARRMYGGADMLLMPSRYEPCGLAQMIGMRYGCLPVARSTGGLRDTVRDNQVSETSTGFLFENSTTEALAAALRRAIAMYNDREGWQARQRCAMQQDFSWQRSAESYAKLYHRLLS